MPLRDIRYFKSGKFYIEKMKKKKVQLNKLQNGQKQCIKLRKKLDSMQKLIN